MRVIDYLDQGARWAPERACLVGEGKRVSHAEAALASRRLASAMTALGLSDNAKVAVYGPNHVGAFLAVLGAFRAGAVWVPLNTRASFEENLHILDNAGCEWLFYHSSLEAEASRLRAGARRLRHLVGLDAPGTDAPSLEALVAQGSADFEGPPDDPSRPAMIFSSSGTTGKPKGCVWTNRTWETMGAIFREYFPSPTPPVHLVAAPMSHAAGALAFPLMAAGATQVILPKADPLAILSAIERDRITHLFLPPTVIYMMLAHPRVRDFDYGSLEYLIYAAAPMSVDKLKEALDIFGPVLAQVYGQAEVPMYMTILSPEEHRVGADPARERRLWSCGRPPRGVELAILDERGRERPTGERGEVAVRGDLVMTGYCNDAPATAEASRFGWHHTGDIGYRDADGYLYLVDRKHDMIISGGFNVYSTEVEKAVLAHAAVRDCAVIGVPDPKWGEAVKAIVELKPGAAAEAREIIDFCKRRIGGVKAPKSVEFRARLPRSQVGKVLKRELREPYWKGRARAL